MLEQMEEEKDKLKSDHKVVDITSLDMHERDPNHLNSHVSYNFHEIIGEPEGAHSADCVWRNAFKCFNCGANCCYTLLTIFCAIPAALCWGCEFACLTFHHIWCLTPTIRYFSMCYFPFMRIYSFCIHCLLDPINESMALVLTRIGVYKSDNKEPPKAMDLTHFDLIQRA